MVVLGYNAQLHCTWRQAGRATARLVASSPSSSAHRCGYGGGHRTRATTGRGGGVVVVAQGGAAWGVGRRELGLGLGLEFKGSEEGSVVGLALSEGGGGGGGGGGVGRGRFEGGGGGGDDEESDGDTGVPVPQQSSSILAWYMDLANRHPISTKAITAAILNFLGDIFCQLVVDKSEKLDVKRTTVITFLGFILVGPTLHTWYLALSKVVTVGGVTGACIRLLLDQFLFSPAFIALFISSLLTLEGRSSVIIPKLKQDWKPAVIANWKLWIPFQFVNFLLVPQQLQVAFANVVALAWNVYLSFVSHTSVAAPAQVSIPLPLPTESIDLEMPDSDDEQDDRK